MLPKSTEKEASSNLTYGESKQLQGETHGDLLGKPKRLAWSSYMNNQIRIAEVETKPKTKPKSKPKKKNKTKESFIDFHGVQLGDMSHRRF